MAFFLPDGIFHQGSFHDGLGLETNDEGRVRAVRAAVPGEPTERLAGRWLFPGQVNAHSHAFQRLIRGRTEYVAADRQSDDFWSWREVMYQAATQLDPEGVFVASRQSFLEMAKSGITTVGEFHYLHHQPDGTPYADREELALQVIRAAREVGLRICLLRVGYARAGYQQPENPRQKRFYDPDVGTFLRSAEALVKKTKADRAVSVGLAPHSVRAVPAAWLNEMPRTLIHMHVAEQPAEIAACLAEHGRRPVELLSDLGMLSERFTAVHGIHLLSRELWLLGRSSAQVCACPSTEANLGDGIVRADELLAEGIGLCLGSDSQASIDLLAEARLLETNLRLLRQRRAVLDPGGGSPEGLAKRLLGFATLGGARSLGLPVGTLSPGEWADFFTVDKDSLEVAGAATPVANAIYATDARAIKEVYVAGKAIVENGSHPLEQVSRTAFNQLARSLP